MREEIPVYVFTGFLESGKTKFIRSTLQDPRFNDGERTLLIACEQGEEEYEENARYMQNVHVEYIDAETDLNRDMLEAMELKYNCEQVMIEYNGMWQLASLYNALPENWLLYQQLLFVDTRTFGPFNSMLRNLMVDKIAGCELVVFNRYSDDFDKMELHKAVRMISKRVQIAYEKENGSTEYDDIEDPLPFDINAPVIEVEFEDFAIWYRDVAEEPEKYDGKRVHIAGKAVRNIALKDGFGFGRKVMTCCEADIQFMGFVCENGTGKEVELPGWYDIYADMSFKFHKLYRKKGPVLTAKKIVKIAEPKNEVATFY